MTRRSTGTATGIFFPDLGSDQAFARQCAALIKQRILVFPASDTIHRLDGFPICRACRRCRTFRGEAATARPRRSIGLRGHLVITLAGTAVAVTVANVDERDGVPNLYDKVLLIGDKGFISGELKAEAAAPEIDLQTPLRKNMPDPDTLARLIRVRRAPPAANSPTCSPPRPPRHATSEALSIAWSESSSPTTSPSWLHHRDSQKTRESGKHRISQSRNRVHCLLALFSENDACIIGSRRILPDITCNCDRMHGGLIVRRAYRSH